MKKLLIGLGFSLALSLCSANSSFAQAPTKICVPNSNGGCQDVTASYPFPVNATASITGFMGNGGYGTLTSTASSSTSTAIPAASSGLATTTAVRITNNGTSEVSCTFATGSATGLTNNIQVPVGSSVVRGIGLFDHIACINQAGDSASNVVVLESGTGLGNDSGGGSSGGSGGNVNITQIGGSNISLGQALSAASFPVVLPDAQITTLTPPAWSNSNQIGNTGFNATLQSTPTTAIGKVDPNTISTWGLMSGTTPGTAPTNTQVIGGIYNSSAPTPSTGQTLPLQTDANGNLKINMTACNSSVCNANGAAAASASSPVTPSNNPVGSAAWAATQVSVASTATSILAARAGVAGTGRICATIVNTTTTAIYLGGSGVTTSTGMLLPGIIGASDTICTTAAIYGIVASSTATVTAQETY